MNADQKFNFPSLANDQLAPAIIENIVPALADVIHDTAVEIAERECGDAATIFDVERIAGDLLYALADLLTLSPVPLRGVRDLLRFHQLDPVHAAAYFDVDIALPLFVTHDAEELSLRAKIPVDVQSIQTTAQPSSRAVVFNDVASAAAVLKLPVEVVEALGGQGRAETNENGLVHCGREGCNNWFKPRNKTQRFCSKDCHHHYWSGHRRGAQQDGAS